MPKYTVVITENIRWTYLVEADNEEQALEKVENGEVDPTDRNPSQDSPKVEKVDP